MKVPRLLRTLLSQVPLPWQSGRSSRGHSKPRWSAVVPNAVCCKAVVPNAVVPHAVVQKAVCCKAVDSSVRPGGIPMFARWLYPAPAEFTAVSGKVP